LVVVRQCTRPGVDRRTAIGKQFLELVDSVVAELGGADHVSAARMVLVRQFATAALVAEQETAQLLRGEPVSPADLIALTGTMSRLAARLGLTGDAGEAIDVAPSEEKIAADLANDAAIAAAWRVDEVAGNAGPRRFGARVRRS
jgi:hypothetical protein